MVVDASKLGHVGFSRICHVNEVSAVLTDSSADAATWWRRSGHRRRGHHRLIGLTAKSR